MTEQAEGWCPRIAPASTKNATASAASQEIINSHFVTLSWKVNVRYKWKDWRQVQVCYSQNVCRLCFESIKHKPGSTALADMEAEDLCNLSTAKLRALLRDETLDLDSALMQHDFRNRVYHIVRCHLIDARVPEHVTQAASEIKKVILSQHSKAPLSRRLPAHKLRVTLPDRYYPDMHTAFDEQVSSDFSRQDVFALLWSDDHTGARLYRSEVSCLGNRKSPASAKYRCTELTDELENCTMGVDLIKVDLHYRFININSKHSCRLHACSDDNNADAAGSVGPPSASRPSSSSVQLASTAASTSSSASRGGSSLQDSIDLTGDSDDEIEEPGPLSWRIAAGIQPSRPFHIKAEPTEPTLPSSKPSSESLADPLRASISAQRPLPVFGSQSAIGASVGPTGLTGLGQSSYLGASGRFPTFVPMLQSSSTAASCSHAHPAAFSTGHANSIFERAGTPRPPSIPAFRAHPVAHSAGAAQVAMAAADKPSTETNSSLLRAGMSMNLSGRILPGSSTECASRTPDPASASRLAADLLSESLGKRTRIDEGRGDDRETKKAALHDRPLFEPGQGASSGDMMTDTAPDTPQHPPQVAPINGNLHLQGQAAPLPVVKPEQSDDDLAFKEPDTFLSTMGISAEAVHFFRLVGVLTYEELRTDFKKAELKGLFKEVEKFLSELPHQLTEREAKAEYKAIKSDFSVKRHEAYQQDSKE